MSIHPYATLTQVLFPLPSPAFWCSIFLVLSHLFVCCLRPSNEIHTRRHPLLPLFAFPSVFHTFFNLFVLLFFSVGFLFFYFYFLALPFFSFCFCLLVLFLSHHGPTISYVLVHLSLYASFYMQAIFIVLLLDESSYCAIFVCTFRTSVD